MKCKGENSFDVNLKLLIDTNTRKTGNSDEWEEVKPKVDFEFKDGVIAITLPLDACFYKSLNED